MPFRLGEGRTTCKFLTSAEMPSLIFEACAVTGTPSNTRYMQLAVCAALARDLDLDYDTLVGNLPPTRTTTPEFNGHRSVGPANTIEQVR